MPPFVNRSVLGRAPTTESCRARALVRTERRVRMIPPASIRNDQLSNSNIQPLQVRAVVGWVPDAQTMLRHLCPTSNAPTDGVRNHATAQRDHEFVRPGRTLLEYLALDPQQL